jgi:hypothetical protein
LKQIRQDKARETVGFEKIGEIFWHREAAAIELPARATDLIGFFESAWRKSCHLLCRSGKLTGFCSGKLTMC